MMPLTSEELVDEITRSSSEGANLLATSWIEECCEIVNLNKDGVEEIVGATSDEVQIFNEYRLHILI